MVAASNSSLSALLDMAVARSNAQFKRIGGREWTREEDQFIKDHLGWMTDAEMAESLGRTEVAVHLRWDRDLGLLGPSKAPDVITANKAALLLGIDAHKTAHWVDVGLIPGRLMHGPRGIRLIQREDLRRWALNPENWIYFNPRKITDRPLRHMAMRRMERWGDEWWSTRQVARYHKVSTQDVKRYIQLGRIQARQTRVSLGGRHSMAGWANWFVLKSEATRPDLVFYKGKGAQGISRKWTPRADAWILKAHDELGMAFKVIERTMKIERKKCGATVSARYYRLKGWI